MKSIILNDTHFGYKADSPIVLEYFLSFFEGQLFPYIKENDIKTIFHLGDVFDRRKYINFKTLQQVRTRFFEPLQIAQQYSNWEIHSEPTEIQTSAGCVALLPWINPENEIQSAEFITNTTCSLLLGHLELCGFQSIRGIFIEHGYDPKHFDKFEYVLTGHYHIKSSRDNIHYLGSQYQMAFSDVWEAKGFHVFDFAARTLEFIENPKRLFYTLDYDEANPEKLDYSKFKDTYVKIFIKNRTKGPAFEKYMDKFYEAGVAELSVTEDVTANPDLVAVDIHKDTLQLLHEEIDTVTEKSINKNVLADIINSAYNAAMSKDED